LGYVAPKSLKEGMDFLERKPFPSLSLMVEFRQGKMDCRSEFYRIGLKLRFNLVDPGELE